jgi:molecular chaperone GrpE
LTKKIKEEKTAHTSELDSIKARLTEKESQLLRALADFDNFRKRANVEKEEIGKYSNEQLIKELLPMLDGFDKAIEFASKTGNENIIKGIALIKKQFEDTLTKFGVVPVDSLGKKYDPNFHEAILMQESKEENGMIIQEMQKGYTLNGRLIRPAMVIVSKGGK